MADYPNSVLGTIALALVGNLAMAAQVDVGEELERLADSQGFELTGAEHVQDTIGRIEGDDPYTRVRHLLDQFDHIILQRADGSIERVIVLGLAMPENAPPKTVVAVDTDNDAADDANATGEILLRTERKGNQHSVTVSLEGADGKRLERALLIDTGADSLVLPASLIKPLGLTGKRLTEREMQTANGRVKARIGRLPAVWLGQQRVEDVAVAFLDDDKLGRAGLLGMSVLGRYQMTIDDEKSTLRLTPRQASEPSPDAAAESDNDRKTDLTPDPAPGSASAPVPEPIPAHPDPAPRRALPVPPAPSQAPSPPVR